MTYSNAPKEPHKKHSETGLYLVRLYDSGFDGGWINVSKEVSWDEALAVWNEKTKNGTRNTSYPGDYFDIFPGSTRMLFTPS